MAHSLHDRARFAAEVTADLRSPERIGEAFDASPMPIYVAEWLARLRLLKGVPFRYLVPDEAMLPAESIRFFQIDQSWIDTLVDGAMSVGRSLSTGAQAPLATFERGASERSAPIVAARMPAIRARLLGVAPALVVSATVSGFVMRSRVVSTYVGLGVNVFPEGHTPADHARNPSVPIELLEILRFEALGDQSDTLLCLVAGDAYRVDVHEAPEELHYGIDSYADTHGTITAHKKIHTFTQSGDDVTISDKTKRMDLDDAFRLGGRRVLKITAVAGKIAELNPPRTTINSAEMGFEMIEGVGMVSFIKGHTT